MPKENLAIKNIIKIYEKYEKPVICGDTVPESETSKYGVMSYTTTDQTEIVKVTGFVEKPKSNPPSNLINAGYFIITPEIINLLMNTSPTTSDGELRVADAIVEYTKQGKDIYGYVPKLPGYDCGNILGFLKATVDFGLAREELHQEFSEFLKKKNVN